MAYIWSYLRRYPKWLAMNFTAAILFVIANLGLPTVLARMIDEGFQCLFDSVSYTHLTQPTTERV